MVSYANTGLEILKIFSSFFPDFPYNIMVIINDTTTQK